MEEDINDFIKGLDKLFELWKNESKGKVELTKVTDELVKSITINYSSKLICPVCGEGVSFADKHCGVNISKRVYKTINDELLEPLRIKDESTSLSEKLISLTNKKSIEIIDGLSKLGLENEKIISIKADFDGLREANLDDIRAFNNGVRRYLNEFIINTRNKASYKNLIRQAVGERLIKVNDDLLIEGDLNAFGRLSDYLHYATEFFNKVNSIEQYINEKVTNLKKAGHKIKKKTFIDDLKGDKAYINGAKWLVKKSLESLIGITDDYKEIISYDTLVRLIDNGSINSLNDVNKGLMVAGLGDINRFLQKAYNKISDFIDSKVESKVNDLITKVKPSKYEATIKIPNGYARVIYVKEKPYKRQIKTITKHLNNFRQNKKEDRFGHYHIGYKYDGSSCGEFLTELMDEIFEIKIIENQKYTMNYGEKVFGRDLKIGDSLFLNKKFYCTEKDFKALNDYAKTNETLKPVIGLNDWLLSCRLPETLIINMKLTSETPYPELLRKVYPHTGNTKSRAFNKNEGELIIKNLYSVNVKKIIF
ncbi:MAG: hypothetical protein WC307_01095 [Candidatus Nanoarchaeia archaeon]|jgi:hypothetical protein